MGANIKGSAITARVRYVRELYGEPGVRRVKEALSPEYRKRLEEKVMPHDWVPMEMFIELCTEIDRMYGRGDLALCRELGRYAAKVNLPTLYRMCDLFAHSALYEGFGIPPLEAMACGAPTLVSDAPALPEVVGDAARIVSVHDLEGWIVAIGTLLQSPEERSTLSQKGLERVKLFNWSETARLTWEVYGKVV